jgi:O-succinylbenzoate synthase
MTKLEGVELVEKGTEALEKAVKTLHLWENLSDLLRIAIKTQHLAGDAGRADLAAKLQGFVNKIDAEARRRIGSLGDYC